MREVSDRCIEVSHAYDVILGVINSSICQVKKRQSCDFWKKAQTLIKMRAMYCNSINCDLRFFLRGTCKTKRLSSIKSVSHTQVILIQLNFLHERRHHKGESLSVEVVERVADKHGQKYCAPVVSITCCGHGCRFSPFKKWQQKNKPFVPFETSAACDSDLCFRIHCAQAAAYMWRGVCDQPGRLMVNLSPTKLI